MNANEQPRRLHRRVLLIAAPFAAGALAAAGLFVGLGLTDSPSSPESTGASTAAVSSTNVAQRTATLSAASIYERTSPGVVDITVTQDGGANGTPFAPGGGPQKPSASGTGYVYDTSGHIITAEHVVESASKITVRFHDGSTAKATLVGTDASTDTAVVKVSVASSRLTPLPLADSSTVDPGDPVVAIGSPFGYSASITAGIVSAVDRTIRAPNGYSISNTIQTDAAINHGNSGGPLIDETGKVIGTNVQIAVDNQTGGGVNAGVGFAVPSSTVKSVVSDLIAGKVVAHAYLGVSVGNAVSGAGARIGTVRPGGPAAAAGLQAGDVVTAIDGEPIADANDLTAAVAEHRPGDSIEVTVKRNGSPVQLTVNLGTRPASTTA